MSEPLNEINPIKEEVEDSTELDKGTQAEDKDNANSDSDDEFYFESDHVALKNNKDYRELLKTLAILEAQRFRALKDIDSLVSLKKKVKSDPLKFVDGLKDGSIKIPEPQSIPVMPNIDWSHYNISISEVNKTMSGSAVQETSSANDAVQSSRDKLLVRGRIFDESKPETFNQLWTVEEQQRLEELLIKHPPEEVEYNRWRKIAEELGNRTAKQVCSRVQKYFLKLQKAGLPVPGRVRKMHTIPELGKRSSYPYQRRFARPTTFFPNHDVPVPLADFDNAETVSPMQSIPIGKTDLKINPGLICDGFEESESNTKVKSIMSSRKLSLLRNVLKVKEENENCSVKHLGRTCSFCGDEPITGVLWSCLMCPAVDFCTDCVVAQLESSNPHPLSHSIEPITNLKDTKNRRYDRDYFPLSLTEPGCSYNYLDPNFMPGDDC